MRAEESKENGQKLGNASNLLSDIYEISVDSCRLSDDMWQMSFDSRDMSDDVWRMLTGICHRSSDIGRILPAFVGCRLIFGAYRQQSSACLMTLNGCQMTCVACALASAGNYP